MSAMASQINSISVVCSTVCQAHINENIKTARYWPLLPVTGGFPQQRDSNTDILPFDYVIMKAIWPFTKHLSCHISITVLLSRCLLPRNRLTGLRILKNTELPNHYDLLNKSETVGIKSITSRLLAIGVYKCVNDLNLRYLNEKFTMKNRPNDFRDNLILDRIEFFKDYGAKTWTILPNNYKSAVSLSDFKNIIKSRNGPNCKCSVCSTFFN